MILVAEYSQVLKYNVTSENKHRLCHYIPDPLKMPFTPLMTQYTTKMQLINAITRIKVEIKNNLIKINIKTSQKRAKNWLCNAINIVACNCVVLAETITKAGGSYNNKRDGSSYNKSNSSTTTTTATVATTTKATIS